MSVRRSRREFLRLAAMGAAAMGLAACGATPTPTPVPKATVAKPAATAAPAQTTPVKIVFWTHRSGSDPQVWLDQLKAWAKDFKDKTKIEVDVQELNWDVSRNTWLLIAQGGDHPDCADMYWLWSFVGLGRGKYGPLPITAYKDELFKDIDDRFAKGTQQDARFKGEFYGVAHRGDPRPFMWRSDLGKAAGFNKPPDTWQELTEQAKAMTKRDAAGNVTMWGMEFGSDNNKPQQVVTFYWQAGGEYMNLPDATTATFDTPMMRDCLKWMYDQIWTHKVVPPDFMEKAHNPWDTFTGQQCAMLAQAGLGNFKQIDEQFPQLSDKIEIAVNAKGPNSRACYYGAGYWGVLRGTKYPYECAKWIAFLCEDERQIKKSQILGDLPTNKAALAQKHWTDRPWKLKIPEILEHAHPSQHPNYAWAKLVAPDPGSVIYDLFYEVLVKKGNMEEAIKTAQKRAQAEMDAAAAG